jgi:DNase/tRNase domain of colicin-like bacteriocin
VGSKLRTVKKAARKLGVARGLFKKAGVKVKSAKRLLNRGRSSIPVRQRIPKRRGKVPPRNAHLAGHKHPVTGVPFDANGYPDFSAYRHPNVPDVRIKLSGNRKTDFARANKAAGLTETPRGYVWHHHQDSGLMQLVKETVHAKTGHTGGFAGH